MAGWLQRRGEKMAGYLMITTACDVFDGHLADGIERKSGMAIVQSYFSEI